MRLARVCDRAMVVGAFAEACAGLAGWVEGPGLPGVEDGDVDVAGASPVQIVHCGSFSRIWSRVSPS